MKLKLGIIISIILFGGIFYSYLQYSQLKSINSYESCVSAKSSVIQTSYPATCITRLGVAYAQTIAVDNGTTSTNWLHTPEVPTSTYTSSISKLALTFTEPVYVAEVFDSSDNINGSGYITISKNKNIKNQGSSYLQIAYGIPYLEGKGGACLVGYVTRTILGQQIQVCDKPGYYSSGYPKHPNGNIEYWFAITTTTKSNDQMFRDIIYSAKFTN
jgi:hypothetical protein